jgi:hypothetical protein
MLKSLNRNFKTTEEFAKDLVMKKDLIFEKLKK